jgi:hypothetical protein
MNGKIDCKIAYVSCIIVPHIRVCYLPVGRALGRRATKTVENRVVPFPKPVDPSMLVAAVTNVLPPWLLAFTFIRNYSWNNQYVTRNSMEQHFSSLRSRQAGKFKFVVIDIFSLRNVKSFFVTMTSTVL